MSKYVRTIYLYLVSLITLCMLVVGVLGTVNSYVAYLMPTSTEYYEYSYPYDYYASEESYSQKLIAYKQDVINKKEGAQKKSLKTMFTYITVIAVSAPLFAFHFKSTNKERKEGV